MSLKNWPPSPFRAKLWMLNLRLPFPWKQLNSHRRKTQVAFLKFCSYQQEVKRRERKGNTFFFSNEDIALQLTSKIFIFLSFFSAPSEFSSATGPRYSLLHNCPPLQCLSLITGRRLNLLKSTNPALNFYSCTVQGNQSIK